MGIRVPLVDLIMSQNLLRTYPLSSPLASPVFYLSIHPPLGALVFIIGLQRGVSENKTGSPLDNYGDSH